MQRIQITRGLLSVKKNKSPFLPGELFLDYTNEENAYELYVGVPSNGSETNPVVKIGTQGVMGYVGEVDNTSKLPSSPIKGGIYYVKEDVQITSGTYKNSSVDFVELYKGDLVVYIGTEEDLCGLGNGWIHIKNSGGEASNVVFDPTNTNYDNEAVTVQRALVNSDRNKLQYGGVLITTDSSVTSPLPNDYSKGFIFYESTIAEKVLPGKFYSIGTLPSGAGFSFGKTALGVTESGNGSSVNGDFSSVISLEEGDILIVTSNEVTNSNEPNTSSYEYTKVSMGTHDSNKVYASSGTRNTNGQGIWESEDAAIKTVQDAINVIYESKADLTKAGKIPLAELPDTVIGSMEYQGTYSIATGSTFSLPTVANTLYSTSMGNNEEESLTKGDYWIYTGSTLTKENDSGWKSVLEDEGLIESAEKVLRNGDWLVYNGSSSTPQWSVVDNTSPILGIKDTAGTVLEGSITISGSTRTVTDGANTATYNEIKSEGNSSGPTLNLSIPNAALITDTEEIIGVFYKEAGNKTLTHTNVSENDNTLIINEKNGIAITGKEVTSPGSGTPTALGTVSLIQNDAQGTTDIDVTLPKEEGTLALLSDIQETVKGTHFYIPRFNEEDNIYSLSNSSFEVIESKDSLGNKSTDCVIGLRYHSKLGSTNLSSDLLYDNTKNVVNILPSFSGRLLNTNSIIDCGEWSKDVNENPTLTITEDYNKMIDNIDYEDDEGTYAEILISKVKDTLSNASA